MNIYSRGAKYFFLKGMFDPFVRKLFLHLKEAILHLQYTGKKINV